MTTVTFITFTLQQSGPLLKSLIFTFGLHHLWHLFSYPQMTYLLSNPHHVSLTL